MQLQILLCYSYVHGIVIKQIIYSLRAPPPPTSKNSRCAPAPFSMLRSYMRDILSPNKCESEYISEELSNGSDGVVNNLQACL